MTLWLLFVWAALGPVPIFERVELYTSEAECQRERFLLIKQYRYAVTDCLEAKVTHVPWNLRRND